MEVEPWESEEEFQWASLTDSLSAPEWTTHSFPQNSLRIADIEPAHWAGSHQVLAAFAARHTEDRHLRLGLLGIDLDNSEAPPLRVLWSPDESRIDGSVASLAWNGASLWIGASQSGGAFDEGLLAQWSPENGPTLHFVGTAKEEAASALATCTTNTDQQFLFVGLPGHSPSSDSQGRIDAFSTDGVAPRLVHTVVGGAHHHRLGEVLTASPRAGGGCLLASTGRWGHQVKLYTFDGSTLRETATLPIDHESDAPGAQLALTDLNLNGLMDLVIGLPAHGPHRSWRGQVRIVLDVDGL